MDLIKLDGENLDLADVCALSRGDAHATLSGPTVERLDANAADRAELVAEGHLIYGVTTPFGGLADRRVEQDQTSELQRNLIHAHRAGTGEVLEVSDVRASMAIRANCLARGVSGIRAVVVERLIELLNTDAIPPVRWHGSIGASGDLVPLAQVAHAVVTSEPRLDLEAKEGLALINGTAVSAAVAARCLDETAALVDAAMAFNAMAFAALGGNVESFDPFIHDHKPHPGQRTVATVMRALLDGAWTPADHALVQDRYSLRCLAQYLGPLVETIGQLSATVTTEINSATDNPLFDGRRSYQGGNFLAEHIATGLDTLRGQIALLVKHTDVQVAQMLSPEFSGGLAPSLVGNPGRSTNLGLKPAQLTANSLMPLVVYHAAPVATLYATHAEQYNQNVNSLSLPSGYLTDRQLRLARQHMAIALLCAAQAFDLRRHDIEPNEWMTSIVEVIHDVVERDSRPIIIDDRDVVLDHLIGRLTRQLVPHSPMAKVFGGGLHR